MPGLELPAVIVANISSALLALPKEVTTAVQTFIIPTVALPAVSQLLPNLSSLATIILAEQQTVASLKLPIVTLLNITTLNLKTMAANLGIVFNAGANTTLPLTTIPGLPAMPSLSSLLRVNATALSGFVSLLKRATTFPLFDPLAMVANFTASGWQQGIPGLGSILLNLFGGSQGTATNATNTTGAAGTGSGGQTSPSPTGDLVTTNSTATGDYFPSSPVVVPSSPAVVPSSPVVSPSSPVVPPSSPAVVPSSPVVVPSSPAPVPSSPAVGAAGTADVVLASDEALVGDASTAYLSAADWAMLSPDDQAALLVLVQQ